MQDAVPERAGRRPEGCLLQTLHCKANSSDTGKLNISISLVFSICIWFKFLDDTFDFLPPPLCMHCSLPLLCLLFSYGWNVNFILSTPSWNDFLFLQSVLWKSTKREFLQYTELTVSVSQVFIVLLLCDLWWRSNRKKWCLPARTMQPGRMQGSPCGSLHPNARCGHHRCLYTAFSTEGGEGF